jgi:hypothetical protein
VFVIIIAAVIAVSVGICVKMAVRNNQKLWEEAARDIAKMKE